MSPELEQLDQTLNSTLTLPDGEEVHVKSLPTKKAMTYLRRMDAIMAGGIPSIFAWPDVIEELGEDLGIADKLGELEIEETTEFVFDFFALVVRRMVVNPVNGSEPEPSSPSSSEPIRASGETATSTGASL